MQDPSPKNGELLSQEEYAEQVGVSPSWISKATRQGKIVDGEYYPARDAVVDESGDLIGYQDPTKGAIPTAGSSSDALPERAINPARPGGLDDSTSCRNGSSAGSAGLGGLASGESGPGNGAEPSTSFGQESDMWNRSQPNGASRVNLNASFGRQRSNQGAQPLQTGLEGAAGSLATAMAHDQGALRGALRLGGAAGGALFVCHLAERNLLSALVGATLGFGIIEYSFCLAR